MEEKFEITRSEIFEVFKKWIKDYREDPDNYTDVLLEPIDKGAESYTKYFLELFQQR